MHLTSSSAIFLLVICAYLGVRSYFKRKTSGATGAVSKGDKTDMALVGIVVVGQLLLPLLAIFTPLLDWATYRTPAPALAWAGALLMAAGVWLLWRSHADLGQN